MVRTVGFLLLFAGIMPQPLQGQAVTVQVAPGYGQAPICLMGNCDQVQGSADRGGSTSIIRGAGMGQGGRISAGSSRPIAMRLPNGSYGCRVATNRCAGDVFIPANASGEFAHATARCERLMAGTLWRCA